MLSLWHSGLAMGAWVSGGISSGHLNPAVSSSCRSQVFRSNLTVKQVTLALATWRGFPWRKVPGMCMALDPLVLNQLTEVPNQATSSLKSSEV
jgi:hypothetical protein